MHYKWVRSHDSDFKLTVEAKLDSAGDVVQFTIGRFEQPTVPLHPIIWLLVIPAVESCAEQAVTWTYEENS